MLPQRDDDTSPLEGARERLYDPGAELEEIHAPLGEADSRALPHDWNDGPPSYAPHRRRQMHVAGMFFMIAFAFFLVTVGVALYFLYFGGNSVSVDRVNVDIQGPTTIAGGDTVPLSLAVTNTNSVAIDNATIEVDFPVGTRSASDVLQPYPRYVENLGTIPSGGTVTRSIKAVVFGGAGQTLSLPVSLSYGAAGTNATFVKKSSYSLAISSTPLSISVDALSEIVSGKPLTLTLNVRSNAAVPLDNVMVVGNFPFGFTVASSSAPLIANSSFWLGTLAPGASKTVTLTGTLTGQDSEQGVFQFTVGTAQSATDQTLGVSYMTQSATVAIAAPFISTTLAINGDSSGNTVMNAGATQNISLSYANTLATNVTNATVAVTISGAAIDYNSIHTTDGFYQSSTHSVIFSSDTDPSLASLAPGATGIGIFTFSTLPSSPLVTSPEVTFTISVSGTRVGQANVPEQVNASASQTSKVATTIALSASALHTSGPIQNTGPIPPRANEPTTYSVVWNAHDEGSSVAGGTVTATLPSYATYTDVTAGAGSFTYDSASRTVTWNAGDFAQGGTAEGVFQVSLTPSTSQHGQAPPLTGPVFFTGYDRFAGVQVTANATAPTTQTTGDPGYVPADAPVQ
ncbi:MAG TPA: hypothetical protein VMV50_02950 [Candidatus Paceibacterota bacterium]|nr:hypothetical protein [Candidatus Paceibacterota bacterium]